MAKKKGSEQSEISLERRRTAWNMRLKGYTQNEIAAYLGIKQQSVSELLERVRDMYRTEFMEDVDQTKQEQVAELMNSYRDVMNSWELSKKVGPFGQHPNNQYGDVKYINAGVAILAEIRKILGADAPIKFDMDFDVSKYSIEDLRRIAEAKSPGELIASGILSR